VTNDRFAGMMMRMCFHDSAIVDSQPPFPQYVEENLVKEGEGGNLKWKGPSRYLETSGADASVLVCPEERYHPNQQYDKTASRVLKTFQDPIYLDEDVSLKDKYQLSYADLLHNGCIAATIYTTGAKSVDVLEYNPFVFGRRDACHTMSSSSSGNGSSGNGSSGNGSSDNGSSDNGSSDYGSESTRVPLCGPTEVLPGVLNSIEVINNWFLNRNMNEVSIMCLQAMSSTITYLMNISLFSTVPLACSILDSHYTGQYG
jgi:hypothetical protein